MNQDQEIAEKSGQPRSPIKSLQRSGEKPPKEFGEKYKSAG
jgi:hypothetical protein